MRSSEAHAVGCRAGRGPLDPKQVCTIQHASLHPPNFSKGPPKHQTPRISLFFLEIGSSEQTTHRVTEDRCGASSPTFLNGPLLYPCHSIATIPLLVSIPLPGSSSLSPLCAWRGLTLWLRLTWSIPSASPQAGCRMTSCPDSPGKRDHLLDCWTFGAKSGQPHD